MQKPFLGLAHQLDVKIFSSWFLSLSFSSLILPAYYKVFQAKYPFFMQQLIAITTDCWSLGLKLLELGCWCTMNWDIQFGFAVLVGNPVTLMFGYGVMHQYILKLVDHLSWLVSMIVFWAPLKVQGWGDRGGKVGLVEHYWRKCDVTWAHLVRLMWDSTTEIFLGKRFRPQFGI